MKFDLNQEQVALRDTVRSLIARDAAPWWPRLAELGLLSIAELDPGSDIGLAEAVAIICEEFGRGARTDPYLGSAVLATSLIVQAASVSQRAALLPGLYDGSAILSVAYRDAPSSGVDKPIAVRAERRNGVYTLNGRKSLALAADVATTLVVAAEVWSAGRSEGTSLFLVDPGASGVTIISTPLADGNGSADVILDMVSVNEGNRIGAEGEGARALDDALALAILAACAEAIGLMAGAVEITIRHLKARRQFGRPLAEFQVLQHQIANMVIEEEMARALLFKLIAAFQDPVSHDRAASLSVAKYAVCRAARQACAQAIQLHGGMGTTEECAIGRYYKRAVVLDALFGNGAAHLANYRRTLQKH